MAEAEKKVIKAVVGNTHFKLNGMGVILDNTEGMKLFSVFIKEPSVFDPTIRSIKRVYTPVTGGWLTKNRKTGEKKERWSGTNATYYVDYHESMLVNPKIRSVLLRPSNMKMTITDPEDKQDATRESTEYIVILADRPVDVAAYRTQNDTWSWFQSVLLTPGSGSTTEKQEQVDSKTLFTNSSVGAISTDYSQDLPKFVRCIVPEKCNGSTLVFSVPTPGEGLNSNFQVKIEWAIGTDMTLMDTKNLIVGIKAATDAAIEIIRVASKGNTYYSNARTGGTTTVTSNPDPISMSIGRLTSSGEGPGAPAVRVKDQWHRTRSQYALALFHAALLLSEVPSSDAMRVIDSTFALWRGGNNTDPPTPMPHE